MKNTSDFPFYLDEDPRNFPLRGHFLYIYFLPYYLYKQNGIKIKTNILKIKIFYGEFCAEIYSVFKFNLSY